MRGQNKQTAIPVDCVDGTDSRKSDEEIPPPPSPPKHPRRGRGRDKQHAITVDDKDGLPSRKKGVIKTRFLVMETMAPMKPP